MKKPRNVKDLTLWIDKSITDMPKPVAAVTNLFRLLDRHPDLLRELQAG